MNIVATLSPQLGRPHFVELFSINADVNFSEKLTPRHRIINKVCGIEKIGKHSLTGSNNEHEGYGGDVPLRKMCGSTSAGWEK